MLLNTLHCVAQPPAKESSGPNVRSTEVTSKGIDGTAWQSLSCSQSSSSSQGAENVLSVSTSSSGPVAQ